MGRRWFNRGEKREGGREGGVVRWRRTILGWRLFAGDDCEWSAAYGGWEGGGLTLRRKVMKT